MATTIEFWYLIQIKLFAFLWIRESGNVMGLSAFAHRYFINIFFIYTDIFFAHNCTPFMLELTAKQFPVFLDMWNMFHWTHEELPHTNNHIEGWHRKFQSICMYYHPTFWKFTNLLKKEQTLNRVDMVQAEAGHSPPSQRRKYVDRNQRTIAIVDDYPNRDNIRCFWSIAYNLGF